MNYTTLTDIRDAAIRLHLDGSQHLAYMPIDVLAASYNGTGPEFLPQMVRERLDGAARPFLPSVMIHDVDFTLSDGSRESFRQANNRLLVNCIACALDSHPWTSWKRYALIAEAFVIYRACSKLGWTAWIQAYNKRQTKGTP